MKLHQYSTVHNAKKKREKCNPCIHVIQTQVLGSLKGDDIKIHEVMLGPPLSMNEALLSQC